MTNVVPINDQDSRINNYGFTEEDNISHLDLGFKFYDLTNKVHRVLGQTHCFDYVNNLSVSANMPVTGGTLWYAISDIFSTNCAIARFGRHAGISMHEHTKYMDRNFLVAVLLVLYTLDQQENWRRRLGAGSMPANEDGMEMTNGQTIEKVADGHRVEDLTASKADTKGVAIDGRRNSYTHAWQ
uniref:Uncharacterized protein n=1 Tax=Oryza glumipatula TaxID=40148 RepID=A0A0E0AIU4_9ORYZ